MKISPFYLRNIICEEIKNLIKESEMSKEEIANSLRVGQKFRVLYNLAYNLNVRYNNIIEIVGLYHDEQNDTNALPTQMEYRLIRNNETSKIHFTDAYRLVNELYAGYFVLASVPYMSQCPLLKKEIWNEQDQEVALDWLESVGYFHYSFEMRKAYMNWLPSELRENFEEDKPPLKGSLLSP